jgi:hypothetical protein
MSVQTVQPETGSAKSSEKQWFWSDPPRDWLKRSI